MKPLQIAVLLLMSWAGSFGIAFGVQEWRGADAVQENPHAALISQAEACQSVVAWWNALKDFEGAAAFAASKAMNTICGELNTLSEPDER